MSLRRLRYLILSDFYRYSGRRVGLAYAVGQQFWGEGAAYTFWMRLAQYLEAQGPMMRPFWAAARLIQFRATLRYGIQLNGCCVGPGLHISHFGGIFVHSRAKIGRKCNISQGVTIGIHNRGPNEGCPEIGDEVFIGPGAKIFGKIKIGNRAAIGANAVVTKNVPENAVVVGIPARTLSMAGSEGYIHNANYETVLGEDSD